MFGSFLLTSIYLQDVLGTGALETGLAFLPMAVIVGAGAHLGGHLVAHAGLRIAMAVAFGLAAAGMLLLSGVDSEGSYFADVLPGMLVAGFGLGLALVAVALSVLTGAADEEAGHALRPEHHRSRDRRLARRRGARHDRHGHARRGGIGRGPRGRPRPTRSSSSASSPPPAACSPWSSCPPAAAFLPKLRLAPRVAIH